MYKYVTSYADLGALADEVGASPVIGLDTETTGLDPYLDKLRLVSINTGKNIYLVDVFRTGGLGPLKQALLKPLVLGHNLKFDWKFLYLQQGVCLEKIWDTFRASAVIYNGKDLGNNLYDLYQRELGLTPPADMGLSDWSGELTKEQLDYAADDVTHLHALYEKQQGHIFRLNLSEAVTLEFNAVMPEGVMELNGFPLDTDMWLDLADKAELNAREKRKALADKLPGKQLTLFGEPELNLDSHDQLLQSLKRLGIVIPDTNSTTLAVNAPKYPILHEIRVYRRAAKAVTSFGPEYLKHIHPKTGRIHTSFWPYTGAGRYSSSDPNLQQIPRSKEYRACFREPAGYCFVMADYSQIELRLAAEASGDPTLIKIYTDGEDAHQRTASIIAQVPMSEVTKHHRQQAKPVNFGLLYGMGAPKLANYSLAQYGTYMSPEDAELFRDRYFKAYGKLQAWQRKVVREGEKKGYCRTGSGRIRYLPKDTYSEWMNTPIQGTGADGLKAALYLAYNAFKDTGVQIILTVHDEIILRCQDHPDVKEWARKTLEECMVKGMSAYLRKVPVVADAACAYSWADK